MIGEKNMTFRIKSKYVFKANIEESGNWSNEIPELNFSKCDDTFLTNRINNINGTVCIQPDRIKFCNIFNTTEQNIVYSWFVGDEKQTKTFTIQKGCYTTKSLQEILNFFDKRIKFTFVVNGKNVTEGNLQVENLSETDIIMIMNRNLILNTGLIDIYNLLSMQDQYQEIPCQKKSIIKSEFDISRTVKEIKLYSKHIFDYKTELCCKKFSLNELNCLTKKNSFYDNQIQSSNLQSKLMKVDRYESNSAKFYFLDFFDELVYFDYCELIVFISNK